MSLWQWARVWVWLAGLGAIETAPGRDGAEAWARGAEARLFLDRPDFFDYPDSDRTRQLAVARFIGEKPVVFDRPGPTPTLFHHILVGILTAAAFFLLFKLCTHMSCQKGA